MHFGPASESQVATSGPRNEHINVESASAKLLIKSCLTRVAN